MSRVIIAKNPDLTFLVTSKQRERADDCPLPLILKGNGAFDWHANSFLTMYGGGSETYNVRPLAKSTQKKAYSLNLFIDFLERNSINLIDIDDSTLYQYSDFLKNRDVLDDTVIKHGRTALEYIKHLNKNNPQWNLSTTEKDPKRKFNVHYEIRKYKNSGFEKEYLHHDSLNGLIYIASEAEYIHDHELIMWFESISCTNYHPTPDNFLISRWEAFTTLLEITGSRISEVHTITRTMIKKASDSILLTKKNPIIREIPVRKGKYKGKTRNVETTNEDIQVILKYIYLIEDMFPEMDHDAIFVDSNTGSQLKPSYLKNYARKVINRSTYCDALKHLSNHSFRHRFITLNIAKAIKKISSQVSFTGILSVASNACRKTTMHASDATLSHYVHLATDYNNKNNQSDIDNISTQTRIRVKKMLSIADMFRSKEISDIEALDSLLSTIDGFRKFS